MKNIFITWITDNNTSIRKNILVIFFITLSYSAAFCQNETKKWYFGMNAGLDFMTSPPTILVNSSMTVTEGCASISDGAGNLLFYTNGVSIWDKTHAVMANGTGLLGNVSTTQSGLIAKQPGNNNFYYVFTLDDVGGPDGLRYSIVDMSLAAGNGSVTVKNTFLYTPSCEKLTAVRHCNGLDVWIISHEWNSNNFRAYLLTPAGINTVAVISGIGTVHTGNADVSIGQMKASPNGKKLGLAIAGLAIVPVGSFELYDFDNATGVVSNSLVLESGTTYPYGCEFSPDGTKFYGSKAVSPPPGFLYQWNICAGSSSAIINSKLTIMGGSVNMFGMQLASNGKIYVSHQSTQTLGVIHDPNVAGIGCNYIDQGQSLSPKLSGLGLPNFITSSFKAPPPPYTFTVSCQTASYTGLAGTNTIISNCTAASYSLVGPVWNFGDPASGTTDTSTAMNPTHQYSAPGTYTAMLVLKYSCSSDTIRQVINITVPGPSLSLTSPTAICKGESATLNASGASSYTWSTNSTSASIVVSPTANIQYSVITSNSVTGCTTVKIAAITVKTCLGINGNNIIDGVELFPNPSNGEFFIACPGTLNIIVHNQLGQIVARKQINRSGKLDLSAQPKGLYFVKISDGEKTETRRLVVE